MPNLNQTEPDSVESDFLRHAAPIFLRMIIRVWFRSRGIVAFAIMAAVAIAGYALLFWVIDTLVKA